MKKKFIVNLIIIISFLFSLIYSNAEVGNEAVFYEDVYNGASFNWEVTKWDIKQRPSVDSYTFFEKGDAIKMEINGSLPKELIIWYYHLPAGVIMAKWFKNDVEFNPLEIDGFSYPYIHSFIFPISLLEDNITSDYFSFHSDILDTVHNPGLEIGKKLGSTYYEISYVFSDGIFSVERYRKYDIETGVLVQYREIADDPYTNTSLEIEFTTTDYEIVNTNFSLVTVILSIITLTILLSIKRKKIFR